METYNSLFNLFFLLFCRLLNKIHKSELHETKRSAHIEKPSLENSHKIAKEKDIIEDEHDFEDRDEDQDEEEDVDFKNIDLKPNEVIIGRKHLDKLNPERSDFAPYLTPGISLSKFMWNKILCRIALQGGKEILSHCEKSLRMGLGKRELHILLEMTKKQKY